MAADEDRVKREKQAEENLKKHRLEQEKAKEVTAKRAEEVAAAVEDFDTDAKLEAFKKDLEAGGTGEVKKDDAKIDAAKSLPSR